MSIKRTLLNTAVGFGLAAGIGAAASAEEITIATVNNNDMIVMQKLAPQWEEATGNTINWVVLEENVLRQRTTHGHRHQRRVVRHHVHRRLRDADLGRQGLADVA